MDAALQVELAKRLDRAGIRVSRDITRGGTVVGTEPVDAAALVAAWTRQGWRVRVDDGRADAGRILKMVRGE